MYLTSETGYWSQEEASHLIYTREKWSFWSMYSSIRHSLLISMELVNTTPAGIALKPGDLATGFGAPEMVATGAGTAFTVTITGVHTRESGHSGQCIRVSDILFS